MIKSNIKTNKIRACREISILYSNKICYYKVELNLYEVFTRDHFLATKMPFGIK